MKRRLLLSFAAGFPLSLALGQDVVPPLPQRAALLIGNHRYRNADSFRPIPAAVADLKVMAAALRATGFAAEHITVLVDQTSKQMKDAVAAFAKKYAGTPEVVVYFSSHGLAAGAQNFLAGVDTNLDPGEKLAGLKKTYGDDLVKFDAEKAKLTRQIFAERCCPLSSVMSALEAMSDDPLHCKIILLDACRTEVDDIAKFSVEKAPLLQGLPEGFAAVEPPSGMFLGFAAKAGQASISNEDGSTTTPSLMTGFLAQRIQSPGTLDEIFRDVRNLVEPASLEVARRHPRANVTRQSPFPYQDLRRPFEFVKSIVPRPKPVPDEEAAPAVRPVAPSLAGGTPATATKDAPYINSLKMEFVPVRGTPGLLWCRWETRVQDYDAFCQDTSRAHEKASFAQGEDHPVVNVSFEDAQAFCAWLSEKDGLRYRLPTDHEWSGAVGIGARENANASPKSKDGSLTGVYPWGTSWPPPANSGNFNSSLKVDSFEKTSPVGRFRPSGEGLYDLSGNVWEWCDSLYESGEEYRVLRGGSWFDVDPTLLLSSCRYFGLPSDRRVISGFRVVLVVGGGG
jgi:uncharacterized caspase-like protein